MSHEQRTSLKQSPEQPKKNDTLVPYNQVNVMHPNIQFNLPLPIGYDSSRIGVDVDRIDAMCKWSGINSLTVDAFTAETDGRFQVGNVNPDGSSSMVSVTDALKPSHAGGIHQILYDNFNSLRRVDGSVAIDIQRLLRSETHQKDRYAIFATGLDKCLRKEIFRLGARNMLGRDRLIAKSNEPLDAFVSGIDLLLLYQQISLIHDISADGIELPDIPYYLVLPAFFYVLEYLRTRDLSDSSDSHKPRFSLFPGYPLDRVAILYADCKINKGLVQVL